MRFIERVFARDPITPQDIPIQKIRRILVVRPHDQLGDFLLSTPALGALRNRFPHAKIGIVVRSYSADAMKNHPHVDQILIHYESIKEYKIHRILSMTRQLIRKWDLTVVLSSESHSLTSDLLAMLSGARYILGSAQRIFPGCTRNFFYNLEAPDSSVDTHQSERNVNIVRYIGADTSDLSETVHVTREEQERIRLEYKHIYTPKHPTIGLHVGANKIENRWPIENFCRLADLLQEKHGFQVVAFWGPKEENLGKQFLQKVRSQPAWVEPSSLRRQAVHFSLCHAAVCNDTGIMHLCAAVGTPLVALFGPTDPRFWKPEGETFIAVRGRGNRTDGLDVKTVHKTVLSLLKKSEKGT